MKVLTVVGARPQLIKAAPLTHALHEAGHDEILVDTGQHYDRRMSQIFFDELGLPRPDVSLGVGSGDAGWQVARMLMELEPIILQASPDWVMVYGDTNSTLAGALAANKARARLAHVEAGLRSFNRGMPEEHNRVLTDHMADMLFCPNAEAVGNLAREGIDRDVHLVGDTMLDALRRFLPIARTRTSILDRLGVATRPYAVATIHRPCNVDLPETLASIVAALSSLDLPVIFPMHPRTRARAAESLEDRAWGTNIRRIEPVGYLDMLILEEHAAVILTDSGGVQREAYVLGVPCVTLRSETEWTETVDAGWNVVVGADPEQITDAVKHHAWPPARGLLPPGKETAPKIVNLLEKDRR